MKKGLSIGLCFLLWSCSSNKVAADPQMKLKTALENYLNEDPKSKGKFHYEVNSVTYFEESKFYICEFKVHMNNAIDANKLRSIDTTGMMKFKIDKGFKVIGRYY